jgi:UDP-N-acetylmuramate--alanine ligase
MKRIHFIGIGGYSMSGLALWLAHHGYQVTGSDMNPSSRTERLARHGIPVMYGHRPSNVVGADEVVYNTDVQDDNVERQEALRRGIRLRHRSDVLADIVNARRAILISGSHGKTTTTTMIGTLLIQAGYDPSVLVGGEVALFDGNVRVGGSDWVVAEADESDGTFLRYRPEIAVATNIEPEHLEHFHESFEELVAAFQQFIQSVTPEGVAVLGIDNPPLAALSQDTGVPTITYGFHPHALVSAVIEHQGLDGTHGQMTIAGQPIGAFDLRVPGRHNVQNALATLAVAHHLHIDYRLVFETLRQFQNAHRRFQVLVPGPVRVVDDYAHHPTEIRATLEACRQVTAGRVVVLFQPQRYVRTQHLWQDFISAFDAADVVILTEIYSPPGERPIDGVSGRALADAIQARGTTTVYFVPNMFDAIPLVLPLLRPGDTFMTMGAGPVYKVGEEMSTLLAQV